jgi:hypothetical protein
MKAQPELQSIAIIPQPDTDSQTQTKNFRRHGRGAMAREQIGQ